MRNEVSGVGVVIFLFSFIFAQRTVVLTFGDSKYIPKRLQISLKNQPLGCFQTKQKFNMINGLSKTKTQLISITNILVTWESMVYYRYAYAFDF